MKNTFFVFLFALFSCTTVWGQYGPINTKHISVSQDDAIMKVLELYENQDVDVFLGTKGRWMSLVYPPVPETGTYIPTTWAVIVDEHPMQGWSHQYKTYSILMEQYVPQSCDTFSYSVIPNSIQNVYNIEPVDARNRYGYRANSKINLSLGTVPTNNVAGNTYAVILNASSGRFYNRERYWNDCSFVYQALRKRYQIPKSHISVLMADGDNASTDMLKADGSAFISSPTSFASESPDNFHPATKAKLDSVFNGLALTMTSSDHLFVCITGDGGVDATGTYASLWGGEKLYAAHLDSLLSQFDIRVANVLLAQSYGGGFVNTLQRSNRVVTAAYSASTPSASSTSIPFDDFIYHWSCAVSGKNLYGSNVNADADNNGRVTMWEAYQYAAGQSTVPLGGIQGNNASILSFDYLPGVFDIYIRDNSADTGEEPNTTTNDFLSSPDLWNREYSDGFINQVSQDITFYPSEYTEHCSYHYIRFNNKGQGIYDGYKQYAHIYLASNFAFQGNQNLPNEQSLLLERVGIVSLNYGLQPDSTEIIEFQWFPSDELFSIISASTNQYLFSNVYEFVCITGDSLNSPLDGKMVSEATQIAQMSNKVAGLGYRIVRPLTTNNSIQGSVMNPSQIEVVLSKPAAPLTRIVVTSIIQNFKMHETIVNEGESKATIDTSVLGTGPYSISLFEGGKLVDSRQVSGN